MCQFDKLLFFRPSKTNLDLSHSSVESGSWKIDNIKAVCGCVYKNNKTISKMQKCYLQFKPAFTSRVCLDAYIVIISTHVKSVLGRPPGRPKAKAEEAKA